MSLRIIIYFLICKYNISYIIFKINVSTYQIRVISDIHIVYVHYYNV